MIPRPSLAAALVAALVCAAALPRDAHAQSKADVFAGKIPPVSGQLYRKAGRFEVTASGNLSLNDAFFTKYFGGVKAGYHFSEHLSAAVHGASGTAVKSGSAVTCTASGGCGDASDAAMRQVPGRIRWLAGLEGAWSPVYGKLNVLSERVAHFDLSVFAGPDVIAYDEVMFQADSLALGGDPKVETTIGGHAGLGVRLFFAQWLAARLEVKDYVYIAKVPQNPADAARGTKNDLQHQLFAELGVSFFLPTRNRPLR
jgi:outer membrane beta-barrel protein